jgi:hypothetical protein
MPLQGAKHTTMTDTIRIALCKHRIENPTLTQKELIIWLQQDEDSQGIHSFPSASEEQD